MKKLTIAVPVPEMPVLLTAVWKYLLAGLLLVPSVFWIAQDRRVWPWDQAWYGEVSVDCWYWLTHSLDNWVRAAADQLNMKPPAIVWAGQFFVPLRHVFGSVEVSLLVFILLTQFTLLLILFNMGRVLSPESRLPAVCGVVFAGGAQLFVGLSHQFFVEPLQAVAVAWALLVALRAPAWPKSRILLHVIANLAFGLLVKASTPAYCGLAWLYCLLLFLRKRKGAASFPESKSRPMRALSAITCALVVLCFVWYLRHLSEVWQHVRASSTSELALDYGFRDTLLHKLEVWIPIVGRSFLSPFLGWACVIALGIAAVSILRGRPSQPKQSPRFTTITFLSAAQILLLLVLFSSGISVDSRYTYAMLPCLAVVFMTVCTYLPRPALIAMLLVCAARWGIVTEVSLAPDSHLADQSNWLYPPHRDPTDFDELSRVVRMTSVVADRYNMVAVDYAWLSDNSAAFFAAKNRLSTGVRCAYISVGYAQKSLDAALRRMDDFRIVYLITVAPEFQDPSPNFLNRVSRDIVETVEHNGRFTRRPFPSKRGVRVFEVRSDAAAQASIALPASLPRTDVTSAPPGIAHHKIEKRGKSSLDVVNARFPDKDHNGRTFIVNRGKGNLTSCIGWAYDELEKSTPEDVWIELTDTATGQHYYWPTHRYDRPELAAAVKVPSVKRAGFNCGQVNYELPIGTYTLKVYQVENGTTIVSDLNTYEVSPTLIVR